ncbi:MAG: DUF692 family protein [Anaerolineaceae bacterium]|nr:DUF692 family protein [Anaerolineaceae bacterium]
MRFAVNYSVPLENLILAGTLKPDLIKCPEWGNILHFGLSLGSCYVHNEIALGTHTLQHLDFEKIKKFLQLTQTPHLNCHLSGSFPNYCNTPAQRRQQMDLWMRDIELLRRKIPGWPIICENLPAMPTRTFWRVSLYPDLLSEFMKESETGLLLDLSHARISCMNYGMDYQTYIAALPVERLSELHITGVKLYGAYPEDHFEMQNEDWAPTIWAAQQIHHGEWHTPRMVAFEYGGVGDIFSWRTQGKYLQEQVPRLMEIFA